MLKAADMHYHLGSVSEGGISDLYDLHLGFNLRNGLEDYTTSAKVAPARRFKIPDFSQQIKEGTYPHCIRSRQHALMTTRLSELGRGECTLLVPVNGVCVA